MLSPAIIKKLSHKIDGEWSESYQITGVGTDTREDLSSKLFIPLIGDSFDGHDFLKQAIQKGAKAALWQEDYPRPDSVDPSFPLIRVKDTLIGLQELAKAYRESIQPIVIAVTGSNGKTTTKDLLYSVCRQGFQTHCTKGNFNNHIGLPLTILSMPLTTEVLILEMGMSDFGEIKQLSQIAEPNIAVITNIGESHIEHLGSRAGIAKAKLEVVSNMNADGLLIYDGDEPLLQKNYPFKSISIGFSQTNDYYIHDCHILNQATEFKVNDRKESISIPLLGKHQAKNATYSIVVGKQLGLSIDQIQLGLTNIETTQMRFEKLAGKDGVCIINDAYNASPTSMKVTIDTFVDLNNYREKILVLGDMLELGPKSICYHQEVGKYIPESIDYVYTIGEKAKHISQSTTVKSIHCETKDELIQLLRKKQKAGTVILFKASRGMKLEQVIHALLM
ncbi:UDP-N-acetylmuramoyl-tripeptide--D-alanyl-D-alanine ligase [Amphibacillus sp. MSJ-3]|uniref:UDP-N-acetylmuramoyl-tripeptide--D-alanyl-D- alanine ligase n=1 Tax=Amphibacillus sp. MSJ-3 TaxID=2841505 RepID=UPI001C0EA07A|nr:UDP-N-acetylmuramoyl-tripeptide--D-alanyl-D-alanine ligase [Amphibacillus sp. MSJ-3]MBU5595396.1 UDP-N-acetylmuramoyl-tripeptide--D-alanyl-D-alanine ligase [Amphibacillus sp. MSJ-3]